VAEKRAKWRDPKSGKTRENMQAEMQWGKTGWVWVLLGPGIGVKCECTWKAHKTKDVSQLLTHIQSSKGILTFHFIAPSIEWH